MSRRVLFISLSFVLLIVIVMANIFVGSYHISLSEAIGSLSGKIDDVTLSVVLTSRINAVVIALVTGAALAVAGLLLQTIFSNPLADPSVLGISSGASVGVSLCMLAMGTTQTALFVAQAFSKQLLVTIASFLGTIPILLLLLLVSKKTSNKLVILITGLMVSFINSSVVSIIEFFSMKESLYSYMLWGMGSFSYVPREALGGYCGVLLTVVIASLLLIKPLNALLLGDRYAENLGVNIKNVRFMAILFAGIIIAAVTAYCGPIGFIGLAVPHIVRIGLGKSNHKLLLPYSAVFGAVFASFCLLVTKLPGLDGALPVNVVTSLIGAPVLIQMLFSPSIKNVK